MLIQHEEEKHGVTLTPLEVTKLCWKEYVPAVVMGTLSIACIISSNHINSKRNTALMGMYSLADRTLKEYQHQVVESVGREKADQIRDRFIKKRLDENLPEESEIIRTGKGETLCYDMHSGRYFYHNIEDLRKIENIMNKTLLADDFVSINDFYYEVNLDSISLGDELGWSLSSTLSELLELRLNSKLTKENEPCVVIDWNIDPVIIDYH
jgi:hypothetical protein